MKRKIFKKLMAASLAAAMAVSMAGCGNGDAPASGNGSSGDSQQESKPSDDVKPSDNGGGEADSTGGDQSSEPEEAVDKYTVLTDENGNPYDLGGMDIKIWSWFGDEPSDDEYGEARTEWREWIQDTYNFTMSQEALGGWGDCPQSFVDYVTTGGDDNNYIFVGHSGAEMIAAMKQGLMYDVGSLDCLDFSERKFQLNGQCNLFSKGDAIYAFMTGYPEPRQGMYVNKRLLEQTTGMTADNLYDMQKENKWNWETWEEIMKQINANGDVDNDGVQDIYPFAANTGSFVSAAVYSNGSSFFGMEDGKYVCKLEDSKTLDALQWASDMIGNYIYPQPEGKEWDYFIAGFRDETKFVFLPEEAYNMQPNGNLNTMEDDFAFLMFPYGPGAGEYVNAYTDNVWALPGCYDADRAWKIMFAYNLWTEEIPGFEDYNPMLSGYYNGARDTRTVEETLDRMMSEGATVKYEDFIPDIDMGNDLLWKVNMGGADIAAAVEACKTKWYTAVDEANK